MLQAIAGLLGGRVRVMVAVEDDLLADLLSHDLLPSRPFRIVGHDVEHLRQLLVGLRQLKLGPA